MFGGSFDYAIEQLKNIVEVGSVTDGANGAIAFSKNETKNIEALNYYYIQRNLVYIQHHMFWL